MNSSGKVLIIFLVITAMLLISISAISLFFFQQETEKRKLAEATLEEVQGEKAKADEELTEVKKQVFLLQEKNKEAEDRINDLSDELELESGLREEIKLEAESLQNKIKDLEKEKSTFTEEMEKKEKEYDKLTKNLSDSEQKIKELEAKLQAEAERSQKLGQLYEQKQKEEAAKAEQAKAEADRLASVPYSENPAPGPSGIELEEIVIAPKRNASRDVDPAPMFDEMSSVVSKELEGRILSVDVETEFVIVSLGERDGLSIGNILSVYRNDDYVGDIKITRLQSEMSAADLVLPLSITKVKKNDQVKAK